MTSEKKKINELVSDDDETTAELEILSLEQAEDVDTGLDRESDEHTYGLHVGGERKSSRGQTIPELRSDLDERTRTIGRLQYDIEQLRSKWLGLETEISAREEIVSNLTRDVDNLNERLTRKNKSLRKRKDAIASLKSELEQRDQSLDALEKERSELDQNLTELRAADAEHVAALGDAARESEDLRSELEKAQNDTATLRSDIEQYNESLAKAQQERDELNQQLTEMRATDAENVSALQAAVIETESLRLELEAAHSKLESLSSDLKQRDEKYASLEEQHTGLEQQYAELEERIASLEEQHAGLDLQLAEHRARDEQRTEALAEAERELDRMRAELVAAREQHESELTSQRQSGAAAIAELQDQLLKAETYADTLRFKFQDLSDSHSEMQKTRHELDSAFTNASERNSELADELATARESIIELQAQLERTIGDHEQEMRTLRFELGEAQSTAAESSELNTQLTSELMQTRGSRQHLEETLQEKEARAKKRISDLEKKIRKLTHAAEEFEQKLDTKSSAINVLLAELAKKTEQMDSISEIEDVVQELDDRMSGHFENSSDNGAKKPPALSANNDREKITRVLIGNVGDQELRFPLFKKRLTIGRTEENDVQLKETYVSRNHAVVVTEGDKTRVIDWGSKNGVYVNSKRVKEHFLSNGDLIMIGNTRFRYEERQKRDT